jgi:mono/diheme cytochrome c family protein
MTLRAQHAVYATTALLALAGCGGGSDDEAASPPGTPQQPGAQVVRNNGCLGCHALNGEGPDGPGSDLSKIGARRTEDEIRKALLEPPSPMPPYTSLSGRDLDALVAYMRSLR